MYASMLSGGGRGSRGMLHWELFDPTLSLVSSGIILALRCDWWLKLCIQINFSLRPLQLFSQRLSDWGSGKALASHCCNPGLIPGVACEMVIWSPSWAGRFPPGTLVSSHMRTTQTQSSVPTYMIYRLLVLMFPYRCKIKVRKKQLFKLLHSINK